jgi:hypothetical protein
MILHSGNMSMMPEAAAAAISDDVSDPLNESDAMTIFFMG